MANKYFIGSVADIYAFTSTGAMLCSAKTLTESSINIATEKTDVRGGKGDVRLGVFFHTSAFSVSITNALFDLKHVAANLGQAINIGGTATADETVTLVGTAGSVVGTPVAFGTAGTIGWAWDPSDTDTVQTVVFTGQAFTFVGGTSNAVCVKYMASNSAATNIIVPGNIIPSTVRLIMKANLYSAATLAANTLAGSIEVDIPSFVFDGNETINMTANGVSNVPLSGTANATFDATCANGTKYATITVIPNAGNWYDNITMLAFADPTLAVSSGTPTATIVTYALATGFAPYLVPSNTGLTFTSGTPATATVSSAGVVTRVATGSTLITVKITAKTAIEGIVNVVSA